MNALVDDFLAHHLHFNPVDATFMGIAGHDAELPPADRDAPAREAAAAKSLLDRVARSDAPRHGAATIDAVLMRAALAHALRQLADRPRYRDPSWYTGEVIFGLVSLMLPSAVSPNADALAARIDSIPRFLREGSAHLAGMPTFAGWLARGRTEVIAARQLLGGGVRQHPLWRDSMAAGVDAALAAITAFDDVLAALPDADPRCGKAHLDFMFRDVHLLDIDSREALDRAEARIAALHGELADMAARLNPSRSWQEQIADLHQIKPPDDHVPETYRALHEQAMEGASALLTPAAEYGLAFKPFPTWAQAFYRNLYFLAYRCPPGMNGGEGSVYWTAPPGQSTATIKSTHAVHHGSIGHHTQNTRARAAGSRLARIANQGVARGIAFQCGLTMGEGWSCYVQELMEEVPGFYSPAEILQSRANELRNACCLVADVQFHTGAWDLAEMRRYYRDEAGFPAARVEFETVKNSIFPANRAMYWLGVEQIKGARRRWTRNVRDFHDGLMARGHLPLSAAFEDLFAAAA
jgi:hypothetical protein